MVDYRGARGSNTGDDFHELWATRQAIRLLNAENGLKALALEGTLEPGKADSWDGVDCALYYGGDEAVSADRVRLEQLKYSGSSPNTAWTVARMTYGRPLATTTENEKPARKVGGGRSPGPPKAARRLTGDGSVISRLAKAWGAMRQLRPGKPPPEVALVTNQPIALELEEAFRRAAAVPAVKPPGALESNEAKLARASGLTPEQFREFASCMDLVSGTGSRFALEDRVLRAMADWSDEDARANTLVLRQFVRERMLPEHDRSPITREGVMLHALGASDRHALFPCPSVLKPLSDFVRRVSVGQAGSILVAHQFLCLHGEGGVGKTTALRQIEADLPEGSILVAFDCYGGGRYLEPAELRHRPADAFTQMANEVATRLRLPLLLSRHGSKDFPRLFMHRLHLAAEALAARDSKALLVVAVDAADNSVTAACERPCPETSFVHDFVHLGSLPGNVRFIVTARTGRLDILKLPESYRRVPIPPFTPEETATFVRLHRREIPGQDWIDEFHRLSGGIPRVQAYAFVGDGAEPNSPLARLRPGKSLDAVFEERFREALEKNGSPTEVARVCAGLIALARPVPLSALAAVLGMNEHHVGDVCRDLVPGVRVEDNAAALADEDFETFVRARGQPELSWVRVRAATWLLSQAKVNPYAALHVAPALSVAGHFAELLDLVEREPLPGAVRDPIQRREVEVQRLTLAVAASQAAGNPSRALRYVLIGAEGHRKDEALQNLLTDNPDLAARFAADTVGRLLLSDPDKRPSHGQILYHRLVVHAERGDALSYREDRRAIDAWMQARQSTLHDGPRRRSDRWPLDANAVAADAEAALKLLGPAAGLSQLKRWSPARAQAEAALALPPRLVAEGRVTDLEALLASGQLEPVAGVFLQIPLALAGRRVDTGVLEAGLLRLLRLLGSGKKLGGYMERDAVSARFIDLLLTGCEILTARDPSRVGVDTIVGRLLGDGRRRIDRNHVSNPVPLDAIFRAYALLEVRLGRVPNSSGVFELRPAVPKDAGDRTRRDNHAEQHDREIQEFADVVFPTYAAVSCALAGLNVGERAVATLRSAAASLEQARWRLEREAGFHSVRSLAARNLLVLLGTGHDQQLLLELALKINGGWVGSNVVPDEILVSRLALQPAIHDALIGFLASAATEMSKMRCGARSRSESLVAYARLLLPLSPDEAAAVFQLAVEAAGELDTEICSQLILVLKLVRHAGSAVVDRRAAALALGEVMADAAVRLDGERHYPWCEAMGALTKLDPPLALAATTRWEARGIAQLWETLPSVLRTGLDEGSLTPGEAAAVALCLEADDSVLEASLRAATRLAGVDLLALREEAARDILLCPGRATVSDDLSATPTSELGPLALATAQRKQFKDTLAPLKTEIKVAADRRPGSALASDYAWTEGITIHPTALAEAIHTIKEAAETEQSYVSLNLILIAARAVVPARGKTQHLDAIAALGSEHERREVIRALTETLAAWESPAVTVWCASRLPSLVKEWLPALSPGEPYGRDNITPLLERAAVDTDGRRDLILGAIQAHVDALGPDALLGLVGLVAATLPPPEVADLLQWYVTRLAARVSDEHLERLGPPDAVPTAATAAVGRFLMAQMGSPDSRARWRAAHALRRLGRTGDLGAVEVFAAEFGRLEDPVFSAPTPAYYPLAACLWATIALDRIATERPGAAAVAGPRLLAVALDESFPHLLLRAFARDACFKLADAGLLTPSPEEDAQLAEVGKSKLPRVVLKDRYAREDPDCLGASKRRRFGFSSLDTVPYWYAPMWRAFSEPVGERFLDAAERWIVDAWGWTEEQVRAAPKLQWRLRRDHSLRYHSHGSRPVIEPLDTHLEWHAMWCAAGELLKFIPLVEGELGDWDNLEERVRREQLSEPPLWAADLLVPTPLHSRHWTLGDTLLAEWVAEVRELDHRVAMLPPERQGYVTVAGYEKVMGPERSQELRLSSALVDPSAAPALLRALQTMDSSWDYKLPEEGDEDFEFDEPPYRLIGWLRSSSQSEGIDEHDPFRGQASCFTSMPGQRVLDACSLFRDASGAPCWSSRDVGAPMFTFEVWGERDTDEDQQHSGTRSSGQRLLAHREQLLEFLRDEAMDLVLEVEVTRSGRRTRRHAGEESAELPETRFDRVYRLDSAGSLYVAEGRLSTWAGDCSEP